MYIVDKDEMKWLRENLRGICPPDKGPECKHKIVVKEDCDHCWWLWEDQHMQPDPVIALYNGQSLAPPGVRGLTAGSGYWLKIHKQWHRIESLVGRPHVATLHRIRDKVTAMFNMREWPKDFQEDDGDD